MIAILTLLGMAAVVRWLGWPLGGASRVGRRGGAAGGPARHQVAALASAALQEEGEAALEALRELDFDYAVGKLAEEDYRALRARLELRALTVLKALDELATEGAPASEAIGERASLAAPPRTSEVLLGPPATLSPSYGVRHRNGTSHRPPARGTSLGPTMGERTPARPWRRWAAGALLGSVGFVLAVGGLYLWSSGQQGGQRALATLDHVGPRALALSWPGSAAPRALLATATGLWRSDDGGATWQATSELERLLRGGATGIALRAVVAAPPRVYAASATMLVRSDDNGRTWTARPLTLGGEGVASASGATDLRALAIDPTAPDRLWIVVEGAGVWRSDDGGASWQQVSAQTPANATALVAVADTPAAPPLLFLASATEGVLASADEGRTWTSVSGALSGALPTRHVSSLSFDPHSGEMATTPDGRELRGTLYAGTDRGLYKTVDRGQLWVRLPLEADVAAVAAVSAREGSVLLAVDRDGHVYRSENRGIRWDGH